MGAVAANLVVGRVALRERLATGRRERVPEPMVMDDSESVAAFHLAHPVLQLPVYRVCSEAMSKLLPQGGRVLDLGSGSGRLLAHLAAARPDVRAVGTDLSEGMLAAGRRLLRDDGVADRVELREGDMTRADEIDAGPVDLVSTTWALHHLPTHEHLLECLRSIARLRERDGCAVWVFDFARLRREGSFPALLRLAADAPRQLQADGIASEQAAWSEPEVRAALEHAGLADLRGGRERVIGHVQCHHAPARTEPPSGHAANWRAGPLPKPAGNIAGRLHRSLPLPSLR